MKLSIKDTARRTGISTDSLRYYDKLGLICPKRLENGYRYYDDQDITSLKYLTVMKYAQFTLAEIKLVFGISQKPPDSNCVEESLTLFSGKIAELKERIRNYESIIALLSSVTPLFSEGLPLEEKNRTLDTYVEAIYNDIQSNRR